MPSRLFVTACNVNHFRFITSDFSVAPVTVATASAPVPGPVESGGGSLDLHCGTLWAVLVHVRASRHFRYARSCGFKNPLFQGFYGYYLTGSPGANRTRTHGFGGHRFSLQNKGILKYVARCCSFRLSCATLQGTVWA